MKIEIYDAGRRNTPTTGYGLMAKEFGNRLKHHKHDVKYFDEAKDFDPDLWLWIRPPHYVKYKQFDNGKKNVFFTMHESNSFKGWKADWIELLNKCTAVITPTEWNKQIFINHGLTVPCYVVNLGVDTKVFIGPKTREFSILSVHEGVGSDSSRDNWKENIEVFYELFYKKEPHTASYTIKSWNTNISNYKSFINKLITDNKYDREFLPEVKILEIDLVPHDMNNLYSKHHAFLKNSAGEGWSLPTLEALACGERIISRPTPSMLTYLNKTNTDFFNTRDELKTEMWKNYRSWRKTRVYVDQFSWKNVGDELNKVLKEINEKT